MWSEFVKNSRVYLDGYTGFTPVQYRIIELLLKYSREVTVSVTVDPAADPYEEASIQHLFYMGKQTVHRINRLAQKAGAKKLPDICLTAHPRFKEAPALGYLEQNLFRTFTPYREGKEGEGSLKEQICLCQASNPGEEVGFAVSRIEQAVRKEGLRYRDIAVITGDLKGYGKEILHQFQEAGIPCFLDDKRNIVENPLVERIRSVLEVVSQDFSYESVFRYLKCGLSRTVWER